MTEPDHLDRAFADYLSARVPTPWPAAPMRNAERGTRNAEPTRPSDRPGVSGFDSAFRIPHSALRRLVLALAAAVLVGLLALPGGRGPAKKTGRPDLPPDATADGSKLLPPAPTVPMP